LLLVKLFANGRNWAGGNAGTAIYASSFITHSLVIFHRKRAYGTYIHAGTAAYAGIFINLYCHDKTPFIIFGHYPCMRILVKGIMRRGWQSLVSPLF
jgi:hypothetical protein